MAENSAANGPDEKFNYQKSVQKTEDKFILQFLRIDKFVNRPVASLIVRAVYRTGVTPNQLTLIAFAFGLAGAYFFSRGTPSAFLAGGILAQASSIMDNADGMLARARNQMSEFGAQLDIYLDRVNEFFLLTCIALGQFLYSGSLKLLIVGLAATALYFLQVSLFYLTKNLMRDFQKGETGELRSWMMFLIFLCGALNRLEYGIYFFFILGAGIVFFQTIHFFLKRKH
jgi:phosphatidylglycerophosphate synthase